MSTFENFFRFLRTPESCAEQDTAQATSLGYVHIPLYFDTSIGPTSIKETDLNVLESTTQEELIDYHQIGSKS